MKTRMIAVVSVAAATGLVGTLVPACSSNSKTASPSSTAGSSGASATSTSTGSSTSAPAAPTDYTTLLIQGSDIHSPPDVFTPVDPPQQNPDGMPGAAVQFRNQDDSNRIGDTVQILPDAGGATNAMTGSVASLGNTVTGGNPQPVSVGNGGTMVSGTSPDKSTAVTVLLFTEGKAFVTLEFDSAPNDVVPPDFATGVAQQQDGAIKNKLPS
jgi:hypothetical protein